MTRGNDGMADWERVNALIDLVQCNSIAAIAADDDAVFDYYLLKLTSGSAETLEKINEYQALVIRHVDRQHNLWQNVTIT